MINGPKDSFKEHKDYKDRKETREGQEHAPQGAGRELRSPRDGRDGRGERELRGPRDGWEDRDFRDKRDAEEAEGHMPEPAPGRRVISFGLPAAAETPVVKKARKPRVQKAVDEYVEAAQGLSEADFAAFNLEDYKDLSASPRRRSREAALLILYAACRGADMDETWSFGRRILADTGVDEDNAVFAMDLARNAYLQREECDRLLSAYAREWDVERFSSVDLSILRLATAELLTGRGPDPTVIINEGVELGKKFGSEESGAFINGMLDSIYNQALKPKLEEGSLGPQPAEA